MDNPDMTLGVEFFVKPVENIRRSKEEGRTIFEDFEYVRITLPGDSKREHVAPAHEMHYVSHEKRQMTYAQRFRASYEAFKDERDDFVHGTPLTAVGFVTPSERAELAQQKVRTVEQLAGLADRALAKMGPGWREKVERAQAFLKASEGSAEVDELKAQIAELKAMLSPKAVAPAVDPFDGFDREDLYNMALDAGLEPRANASAESLKKLLSDAAAKKEAA
jgi:hypothetical protein